jgi:UPF0755 protein
VKYFQSSRKRKWPRRLLVGAIIFAVLVCAGAVGLRYAYNENLKPVSTNAAFQTVTIENGATVEQIAEQLKRMGLIRNAWAFRYYVGSKAVSDPLQAGTYELAPSQGVKEIVGQLTGGRIATDLVTILPGQRLDQIRTKLIQDGFTDAEVDAALNPATFARHPALADKPADVSIEGFIYPDSYQKSGTTNASSIIGGALDQMNKKLTSDIKDGFAKQGLTTYEGIVLASIVEREVSSQEDRNQAAQVFLKRLKIDMRLQSDATSTYGAILNGDKYYPGYQSIYNTYQNAGLPPTPVSNVSESSLKAVAFPANTDWLYFVSGDDGKTHFSTNLQQHESNVRNYCSKCSL